MQNQHLSPANWIDWRSIEIAHTEAHFSSNDTSVRDRIRVTLDMPRDTYKKLRQQIEAPESLRDRRQSDQSEEKPA